MEKDQVETYRAQARQLREAAAESQIPQLKADMLHLAEQYDKLVDDFRPGVPSQQGRLIEVERRILETGAELAAAKEALSRAKTGGLPTEETQTAIRTLTEAMEDMATYRTLLLEAMQSARERSR